MRPTGPGENRPPGPRQGQRWREPAQVPQHVWRERHEVAAWRAHAGRNGHRAPRPTSRYGREHRVLRGLSGSVAAGLVLLALGLVGVQLWQSSQGEPGPEWPVVLGHVGAAALAVVFQRAADRRRDASGVLAAVGVFLIMAVTLWIWWLS